MNVNPEDRGMTNLTATMPETMTIETSVSLKDQLHRAERMKKMKYGALILPLVVFFALQRYFVRGLTSGAVKG